MDTAVETVVCRWLVDVVVESVDVVAVAADVCCSSFCFFFKTMLVRSSMAGQASPGQKQTNHPRPTPGEACMLAEHAKAACGSGRVQGKARQGRKRQAKSMFDGDEMRRRWVLGLGAELMRRPWVVYTRVQSSCDTVPGLVRKGKDVHSRRQGPRIAWPRGEACSESCMATAYFRISCARGMIVR